MMYAVVRFRIDWPLFAGSALTTLFYFVVPVVVISFFASWLIGPGFSQRILIALQLFRAIGAIFLLEWWRGTLPGIFAWPAGAGDVLVALIAAGVLWQYRDKTIPLNAVYLVAMVGIADFISAFFFGFTSSASPMQLFAFDHPNTVDLYPTGLIPQFLVPFAFSNHILALRQVSLKRNGALGKV